MTTKRKADVRNLQTGSYLTAAGTWSSYRVLRGISYPGPDGETRREPGEIVSDLTAGQAEDYLSCGAVEAVDSAPAAEE